MLIDTHAHVNFAAYKDDGDEVVKRALENNVWIINVGSQQETSRRAIEYAEKFKEGVFASVALHPIHLKGRRIKEEVDKDEAFEFEAQAEKFDYGKYKELAMNPKVVAIGETGLDYYHLKKESPEEIEEIKELQKKVFSEHLRLAEELGKPVAIHCREAHDDVLEILKSYYSNASHPPLNLRGGGGGVKRNDPFVFWQMEPGAGIFGTGILSGFQWHYHFRPRLRQSDTKYAS